MFAQWKYLIRLVAVAVVFAALAGAILGERVAIAQGGDNDYVDVGLTLEAPEVPGDNTSEHDLKIIVVNHGSRTAYDVDVVVNVVYPEDNSHFNQAPAVPIGSASLKNNERTLEWSIPSLGGLQREEVIAEVQHVSYEAPTFDYRNYPHEHFGEVSTSSFESELHKGNNTARVWSYRNALALDHFNQVAGNYSVAVSVDKPSPAPGDAVNFTITSARALPADRSGLTPPPIDLKVDIQVTGGLTVNGGPTYDPATKPASVEYDNGVFNVGTLKAGDGTTYSVTLPFTVASDAVVNKQCLTAKLTGNPPPDVGPHDDDISDNEAKVCLGDQPVEPLASGQVDAFTIYPCVGNTNPPCDSTDDVRVRAVAGTEVILGSGRALVHVHDKPNRKYDAHANSITGTDDSKVTWRIPVTWDGAKLSADRSNWNKITDGFALKQIDDDSRPGSVHIRAFEDTISPLVYKMNSATTPPWVGEDTVGYDPSGAATPDPFEYFAEFEKLGTYKLDYTVKLTRATADGDENCDPNTATPPVNQRFCDTETYVFHVGPIAELEVRDGGASGHASADQSALAIVAVNNGPDKALGGARVTGLPKDAEVIHTSQGSYDEDAGVWNIGELKVRGYYGSRGEPDPTLILAATAGDTATVRIASTKNYEVCVGPKSNPGDLAHNTQAACEAVTNASWNSTPVYDYNSGNNTAKITAVKGTGDAWPDELRFAATPLLTWEAVPHVNDWPVHRYQVQYQNGDNWQDLAEVPGDQTYFADSDARSKPSYRVRALNEAGVPGFWSRPASQVTYRQALPPSPPLNVTAVAGHAGEVLVSWELPVDDGGSPITYYQVQWSRSGTSGWSNACRSEGPSDLSCTQTGIPAGETRYYRVAAYAGGLGDWSDLAVATTIPGVPSAPRSLSASRAPQDLGGETILAIRLTWSAPATDNGSPIYMYAIEYVDYDQSAGRCGTDWQYLGGDPSVHSNDPPTREFIDTGEYSWIGLEPGAHRCYRVSAINSAGEGPFSNVARASAGGEVPPEWVYLDGEADGQDAITLYWGEPHYDGGAPVTGYQLQYSEDGSNWRSLTSTSGSARSYTHTGRKVGETWHYRIRARNSAGWSEWSYPISVTIEEGATANLAQPSLTAQAKTSTEVLLSWNSLCNHNKEGDCEGKGVDGYMVQYSEDGGLYGWESLTWLWTDQTKVVDSTVEPGAHPVLPRGGIPGGGPPPVAWALVAGEAGHHRRLRSGRAAELHRHRRGRARAQAGVG